ncbi:MAG TPA: SRPBCC family protein, partial [Actinomycetota bacterium]|nr:SRPBCC family protein [Actinomycetota bacterium]
MTRYQEQISVDAPAGAIYDYVSDFGRHGEWSSNGLTVTADGSGPEAVGSTFSTTAKQFGTQKEHSTITEMS